MRIAVGSDHAGFELKKLLLPLIKEKGHEVSDLGTHDTQAVDYPDFAAAVGKAVCEKKADRGIVICGSGVGASIAANKIKGVRAGLCHDTYSAHQGVEHDDMNVLVMGSRVIGSELAKEITFSFLGAKFTQEERHKRRLEKIKTLEAHHDRSKSNAQNRRPSDPHSCNPGTIRLAGLYPPEYFDQRPAGKNGPGRRAEGRHFEPGHF